MVIFSMIILIFFAIIGLCSFITALLDISCKTDSEILVLLRGLTPENAEARIRSAARLCMHRTKVQLLCVCKENDPAADICKLLMKDYPFMRIIDPQDLSCL